MTAESLEFQAVVNRLEKLEEQNRRLDRQNRVFRIFGIVIALLISSMVLLGQAGSKLQGFKATVIEAQKFVLKGTDGKTRATLGVDEIGRTDIMLFDEEGEGRAALGVFKGVPALRLFDEKGEQCVTLNVSAGSPLLDLREGDAKRQYTVSVSQKSGPCVHLFEDGRIRCILGLGPDGSPVMELASKDNNSYVRLSVTESRRIEEFPGSSVWLDMGPDGPTFTLTDKKDKILFKAP